MREIKTLVLGAAALSLAFTTGCGVAIGTLTGSELWGDGHSPWAEPTLANLGQSVVCLGTTATVGEDDTSFRIHGQVLSSWEVPDRGFDNVIPCWTQPSTSIKVVDDDGETWTIGYAWIDAQGWEVTPWVNTWEGDLVTARVNRGAGDSAGFGLFRQGSLVYAMESGQGGTALTEQELPGLRVQADEIIGSVDTPCGERKALAVRYLTDDDDLVLYPDEDGGFRFHGMDYTACNITSYEMDENGLCDEDSPSDVSWVVFDRSPTSVD